MLDYVETVAMHHDAWGSFLVPDPALEEVQDLHQRLGIPILSGHHADLASFGGQSRLFERIAAQINNVKIDYEDQCTAKHYFDVFSCVERSHKELTRIVDVGVFMGGTASVFAGCVEPLRLELDLVDVNHAYLLFTYERLRRIFPEAISKVRMFYGDLPTYVQNVLLKEVPTRAMIHHDGAHDFNQVVKDLSSLYFARDRVHGLAVQDTHLRGDIKFFNFVDAAVYATFGVNVKHRPLGTRYGADSPRMNPDQWNGNYFMPDRPEGMYIPFSGIKFSYPHPSMGLEAFLPVKAEPAHSP